MALPGILASMAIGAGGKLLGSLFGDKEEKEVQEVPMLTPNQQDAENFLAKYMNTGQIGSGYTAGEKYPGKLGEYEMTPIESAGQSKLAELINSELPEMFNLGKQEYKDLLSTDKYDPYAKGGVYSGFKKDVMREAGETSDILKRGAAVTGDLYSTKMIDEQGELAERTQDMLSNKLAELYQDYSNKRLVGATTAANMGLKEEDMGNRRIGLSQSFGALERLIKDQQAKDEYAAWLKGRSETQSRVDTASNMYGRNVQYGTKSYTEEQPESPFTEVLNAGLSMLSGDLKDIDSWGAIGSYFTG